MVILPKTIPGGISLKWGKVKNYNSLTLIILPFIIMTVVYFDKRNIKTVVIGQTRQDKPYENTIHGFLDILQNDCRVVIVPREDEE